MKKKEPKMLKISEVAERIGAKASSIRVWLSDPEEREKRFPGARKEETPIGSYWLIPETALENFSMGTPGRPRKLKEDKGAKQGKRKN
jgi:hypothetical protein